MRRRRDGGPGRAPALEKSRDPLMQHVGRDQEIHKWLRRDVHVYVCVYVCVSKRMSVCTATTKRHAAPPRRKPRRDATVPRGSVASSEQGRI